MDDSFDDELFGDSEPSEVMIENNSQETDVKPIVSQLNDIFAVDIRKILKEVVISSRFNNDMVSKLCDDVFERCESNWTYGAEIVLSVLADVAEMEWCDGTKCIIRLFTSVAIRMLKVKHSDSMWKIIQTHCDQTCFCTLESIRIHGCLVITECLRLVNEKVDEEKGSQGSDANDLPSYDSDRSQNAKLYNFIPRTLIERWAKVLSQRRLDKSSSVRAIGVSAVGALPHSSFLDYQSNEFNPNDLVVESLRDVDGKVREAAIKALSILSPEHIEETINRLRAEEKPELRRLMAAKLIQEVHVMSFTEEQRATFLTFLYDNNDKILSRMARERLIPKWEHEQDADSALNSLFDPSDEDALRMYISNLFRDDLKKSENAWEFVEIVKEENPEMICVNNWDKSLTGLSATELSYGVLLLECTFSILSEACELDSCLTRLVPSLADVCRSLKKVSVGWLAGNAADRLEEKLMVRLLTLVARFDRFDSDGMIQWEELLRFLVLSLDVKPSKILVELCMDQLIGVFGSEDGKMEETRSWAVDKMEQLLFDGENVTEDDSMKWRCSLILNSLVKCLPTIDSATVDLAARLTTETFASEWDLQRELNICIISLVGCLKKDWLEGTMMLMLRTALQVDDEPIKVVCLKGLVDLISIHSPPVIADLLFPEWEDDLISRETKLYQLFDEYVDPTSKSPLSITAIHCTLRLVHDWSPSYPIFIYNLLLFTTRENEGERAGLEKAVIEEMKRRMEKSKAFRLMVAHSMYCLIERQKGDSAYKCSITSTLIKAMIMLRDAMGEEDEKKDFEEWLVPMIILDAIIEDPESSMNRALVNSLGCMKRGDGGSGISAIVKKMETAIERLAIYDEKSSSKTLVKVFERIDGRQCRKRKMGGDNKKGRKRVKEEDHDETLSSDITTHTFEEPLSEQY